MQRVLVVVQVEHPIRARGEIVNCHVRKAAQRVVTERTQGEHALERALAFHRRPLGGGIRREKDIELRFRVRGDVGKQMRVQIGLRLPDVSVRGQRIFRRGEAGGIQRDGAVFILPRPAIHAVADGIVLLLPPCAQAARQERGQHAAVEPIGYVVEEAVVIEVQRHVAAGLVEPGDEGIDVQPVDDAAHVVRAESQIHQQRVVIGRSGGGAQLDKAAAEQRIHLRRPEILGHGCADDGAVVCVAARNARVGVDLRGSVNRRQIARRRTIHLKRINDDHRQADGGDCGEQKRKACKRPSFSFHQYFTENGGKRRQGRGTRAGKAFRN